MFRISFTVRDQDLAGVLHRVESKVYDLEVAPLKVAAPDPETKPKPEAQSGRFRPFNKLKAWPVIDSLPAGEFRAGALKAKNPKLSPTAIYKAIKAATEVGVVTRLGDGIYRKEAV